MISDRIDAITSIPQKWRGEVIPAPRSVKIELTANCNYKCSFCTKSQVETSGHMDRDLYSRLIREMREAGVDELGVFYIGESFTCPWLPEAIQEAKALGYPYVFITTNGAAATEKKLFEVMDSGLDSLKFSLNFYSPEQLASIAKVHTRNFRRAIDAVKMARRIRDEHGFKCGIYASSIAFDGTQGQQMREVVDEIRPYVDEHYWLPLYGMSGASKAAGWKPKPGNPGRLDAMRDPLPCWSVFTEGHVTRDGKLSACCFGGGKDMEMADLNEVSFLTGWNSPKYQELRRSHLSGDVTGTPCQECAAG